MWIPEVGVNERLVRAAVGYAFLLLVFRLTGKRQVGQMTPFDLVVVLIVSNVLQNAMIGNDSSITGGIIGALAIFALNGFVARLAFHSRAVERLLEGQPTLLVHDGRVDEAALRRELVTREELHQALRSAGMFEPHEARFVMLEPTGRITAGARRR